MRRVELKITFIDDEGAKREEIHSVETSYNPDSSGEHRLAHILATEMNVMVGEQSAPKHNAVARGWLEFPGRPAEHSLAIGLDHHWASPKIFCLR